MKKFILPSFAGLALVAGSVLLSPISASADGYVPNDPCEQSCATSTVTVPDSGTPQAGLADTGSTVPIGLVAGGGAAVVLGVSIVVIRRRTRTSD